MGPSAFSNSLPKHTLLPKRIIGIWYECRAKYKIGQAQFKKNNLTITSSSGLNNYVDLF